MIIVVYFYISIAMIALLILILFFIRNAKTCKFRIYILNMSHNHVLSYYDDINWNSKDWRDKYKLYEEASSICQQINSKYEYDEMLYSTKPLKLDKWFTEEEIKFIEFGTLN